MKKELYSINVFLNCIFSQLTIYFSLRSGLITPSGLSSVGAGLETPDMIELRKRKEIEDAMETGGETPALFTVLTEKRAAVGAAMMGSAHTYDIGIATPKKAGEGVEITLDPSELELEPAAMAAKYDDTMKEREAALNREDLSDMVAEHAAKKVIFVLSSSFLL